MSSNYLLISDNKIKLFNKEVKEGNFIDTSSLERYKISETYKNKIDSGEKYDAIFINIEAKINGSNRSELKGIELIFWLRLKENYLGTIITYGFLSSAQVLRLKPEYVVIHGPGNYHFNLPNGFNGLNDINLKINEFEKKNIRLLYIPIVKKMLSLEAIRHKEANWWGIKTLWDSHKVFTAGKFKNEYPDEIKRELELLNNFLYTFCYGTSQKRLSEVLDGKRKLIDTEIENLKNKLQNLQLNLEQNTTSLEENQMLIDICIEDIENINTNILNHLIVPEERKPYLDKLKTIISQLEDYKKNSAILTASIIESDKVERVSSQELNKVSLSNEYLAIKDMFLFKEESYDLSEAKVLLIDDQASDGWAEIYQHIIYGKKNNELFTVLPVSDLGSTEDIKFWADEVEDLNEFDFILLDLRLFPKVDKEIEDNPELISGIKVLKYLRANKCFVPVLITSASNKIWSYKTAIKCSADTYWCKEGVDNLFDAEASMSNYFALRQTINSFVSDEYACVKLMSDTLIKFKSDTDFWWKRKDWGESNSIISKNGQNLELPRYTEAKLNDIKQTYTHATNMYKDFVRSRFHTKEITKGHSWFYYAGVIIQLAKILELIHNVTKERYTRYGSYNGIMKARNDYDGKDLYSIRNDAAHYYTSKKITLKIFENYLIKFNNYLING